MFRNLIKVSGIGAKLALLDSFRHDRGGVRRCVQEGTSGTDPLAGRSKKPPNA
ncbi:MAG: hypothetical protein R3F37_05250 [Candidatus Competibacteraceae bacterium]